MEFTGKERDAETGLDNFLARYMSSAQGRFMSPDPFGGHIGNPQTLNRYAYAGNNPLRYTDSTGLDFYLDCKGESDACHNGHAGTTTMSDGKKSFEATLVNNGANGTLVDQHGQEYSGNFDEHGIHFTDSNGNGSSGEFTGKNQVNLSGAGMFAGFTAGFNGNGVNTNIAQGTLVGSPEAFKALLGKLAGPDPGFDPINKFHVGINYRGETANGASAHLTMDPRVSPDGRGFLGEPFHFDGAYPYGDLMGFFPHTGAVMKNLFETKILRMKDPDGPPIATIPH